MGTHPIHDWVRHVLQGHQMVYGFALPNDEVLSKAIGSKDPHKNDAMLRMEKAAWLIDLSNTSSLIFTPASVFFAYKSNWSRRAKVWFPLSIVMMFSIGTSIAWKQARLSGQKYVMHTIDSPLAAAVRLWTLHSPELRGYLPKDILDSLEALADNDAAVLENASLPEITHDDVHFRALPEAMQKTTRALAFNSNPLLWGRSPERPIVIEPADVKGALEYGKSLSKDPSMERHHVGRGDNGGGARTEGSPSASRPPPTASERGGRSSARTGDAEPPAGLAQERSWDFTGDDDGSAQRSGSSAETRSRQSRRGRRDGGDDDGDHDFDTARGGGLFGGPSQRRRDDFYDGDDDDVNDNGSGFNKSGRSNGDEYHSFKKRSALYGDDEDAIEDELARRRVEALRSRSRGGM